MNIVTKRKKVTNIQPLEPATAKQVIKVTKKEVTKKAKRAEPEGRKYSGEVDMPCPDETGSRFLSSAAHDGLKARYGTPTENFARRPSSHKTKSKRKPSPKPSPTGDTTEEDLRFVKTLGKDHPEKKSNPKEPATKQRPKRGNTHLTFKGRLADGDDDILQIKELRKRQAAKLPPRRSGRIARNEKERRAEKENEKLEEYMGKDWRISDPLARARSSEINEDLGLMGANSQSRRSSGESEAVGRNNPGPSRWAKGKQRESAVYTPDESFKATGKKTVKGKVAKASDADRPNVNAKTSGKKAAGRPRTKAKILKDVDSNSAQDSAEEIKRAKKRKREALNESEPAIQKKTMTREPSTSESEPAFQFAGPTEDTKRKRKRMTTEEPDPDTQPPGKKAAGPSKRKRANPVKPAAQPLAKRAGKGAAK